MTVCRLVWRCVIINTLRTENIAFSHPHALISFVANVIFIIWRNPVFSSQALKSQSQFSLKIKGGRFLVSDVNLRPVLVQVRFGFWKNWVRVVECSTCKALDNPYYPLPINTLYCNKKNGVNMFLYIALVIYAFSQEGGDYIPWGLMLNLDWLVLTSSFQTLLYIKGNFYLVL